ncbi:hypothetical protein J2S70_001100 [Trueperella bonasi]|uniref:General stress protein 17M-like domain-containing protein n=1 Tax=Trueperella bonasi TaxID=312286 RepID=A0ABT9NHN0_9ACTO|nr:general stress protein [Trueperella bonasi]MDP9806518.1 hypothetical protein [Trueperella bonasi]
MTDYRMLAEVEDYQQAQFLVDGLSDAGFPVEHTRIIGTELETVEDVRGRKTVASAAGQGALSGIWLGVFLGLMFFILAPGLGLLATFGWPILFGAVFGAIWGAAAHWATRGQRDFSSIHTLRAQRYEVQVRSEFLEQANQVVTEHGLRPRSQTTVY